MIVFIVSVEVMNEDTSHLLVSFSVDSLSFIYSNLKASFLDI